ncbi:glycoside hydrolase family 53 protein [Actinoplanes derwentensis]|uniref:Arabinogalactan endo-beta-1,4-galactanase n=1 Tax=Actinoplanes derwentensis TaxID=113562 RepID=A0A1H1PHF1_9ACTN|nr:glycosyl hydrolase 53 family protein [Actinoplanes derwentensis]GID84924.1 arabinogalactan endo-beta-1,4-galactanase [Actinoplanes derwentensis]SDS10564.1 arabinogalactan endo-1,4-beta-galactosidase [Actinoplanes derwentensis]
MKPSLAVAAFLAVALIPSPAAAHEQKGLTMRGADVSTLQRSLELGQKFYDVRGKRDNPYEILQDAGVNYVRLRIWNNPTSGYSNKAKVLQQARAAKAKGMKLLVDFHYSDTWADPGKQFVPKAWDGHTLEQLEKDVYDYTYDVCSSLKKQGTTPDSVQVGNEINTGMLWPTGYVNNSDFTPLTKLLNAGHDATKACSKKTQVMVHTALAGNIDAAHWFYDGITAAGAKWDITALSYYCMWHGSLTNLSTVVGDVKARYGKPVVIAETAYPYTTENFDHLENIMLSEAPCDGVPATQKGQAQQFAAVQTTARDAGAIGVFYWEPTWTGIAGNGWDTEDIENSGNAWENMATFDDSGRINPYVRWLR